MAPPPPTPLNNTAVVILAVLNRGPRSGYDVKAFVDKSARHFWAASYGRIYPELKRLTEAGLIEGADDSQGARPKTIYSLTEKGTEALNRWYARPPETFEMRDEALLKIFFGGAFDPGLVEQHIDARRRESEQKLVRLREVEPHVEELSAADPYPYAVLRGGIEMHESILAWCERTERTLAKTTTGRKG
ncbi:MAG: PadR family transcriptional regulator [Solirubrobacterales bacterium]